MVKENGREDTEILDVGKLVGLPRTPKHHRLGIDDLEGLGRGNVGV